MWGGSAQAWQRHRQGQSKQEACWAEPHFPERKLNRLTMSPTESWWVTRTTSWLMMGPQSSSEVA